MSQKEHGQTVPDITILIDGKEEFDSGSSVKGKINLRNGENIHAFEVQKQMNTPDFFEVRLAMMEDSDRFLHEHEFEGKELEIKVGYDAASSKTTIMLGEISYVEPVFDFEGGTHYIILSGYDKGHRLTRGMGSRTWGDGHKDEKAYDSIVNDVINDAGTYPRDKGAGKDGLSVEKKDASPVKVNYMSQVNVNDYLFIQSLGHQIDMKTDSNDVKDQSKIFFKKPEPGKAVIMTICYDKEEGTNASLATRTRFKLSTVNQYSKVVVRGWDPKTVKAIVGESESSTLSFGGTPGWERTNEALGYGGSGKAYVVVNQVVQSADEATAVAQSIFDRTSMDFLTVDSEVIGDPVVNAGEIVEFKGFSSRYDGKYLVVGCTHLYYPDSTGFRTIINGARNDVGSGKQV